MLTNSTRSTSAGSIGYVIRQPTTTEDDGTPSTFLKHDVDRVLRLAHDERHLTAYKLLEDVKERFKKPPAATTKTSPRKGFVKRKPKVTAAMLAAEQDYKEATELIEKNKAAIEKLVMRAKLFQKAQQSFDSDENWILSQTLFGITTYYRKELDQSLSIKMEGEIHGCPIFEQLAVLKEVDLHYKWAPFCTSSLTVKDFDKLDTVGWFCLGAPQLGLARDGCFRAVGCDNIMEDGRILLVGQGIQDRGPDKAYDEPSLLVHEELDIPDPPTRLGSGRMTIKGFSASIEVLSPTSVRSTLVANVNPNIPLIPQVLLEFIMRKICGVIISKLQGAAKKASKHPIRNVHARRMRQEDAFYRGWLLPKFKAYCNNLNWDMPRVAAFSLTETELNDEADWLDIHMSPRKAVSFEELHSSTQHEISLGIQSEPHDMYPGDDVSAAMSSMSGMTNGTIFSKNPLSNYLRELEQKTEARKARKIELARQRAANRLKPKAFNEVDIVRLEELKKFKESRMNTTKNNTHVTTASPSRGIVPIGMLHKHGRNTQILMICSLTVIMFAILYADEFIGFHPILASTHHSWLTSILFDIGTLGYLIVCAVTHFVLCDVALVYAFDALEIGMKTGRDTKKFYDGTIRVLVAVASGGFIAIAIVKAMSIMFLRNVVWFTIVAGKHGNELVMLGSASLQKLPFAKYFPNVLMIVPMTLASLMVSAAALLFRMISSIIFFVSWILDLLLLQSNGVGGLLSFLVTKTLQMVPSPSTAFINYVEHVMEVFENDKMMPSWRIDAIDTSRFLLSNTAVFLLCLLFLFTASAKSQQRRFHVSKELREAEQVPDSPHSFPRSVLRIDRVDEHPDEDASDKDVSISIVAEVAEVTTVVTENSRKKRRFPKLRFRRKKDDRSEQSLSSAPVTLLRSKTN